MSKLLENVDRFLKEQDNYSTIVDIALEIAVEQDNHLICGNECPYLQESNCILFRKPLQDSKDGYLRTNVCNDAEENMETFKANATA